MVLRLVDCCLWAVLRDVSRIKAVCGMLHTDDCCLCAVREDFCRTKAGTCRALPLVG